MADARSLLENLQLSKLQVNFGDPEFGWIPAAMTFGTQNFELGASHIFEVFTPLIEALRLLYQSSELRVVTLLCEPTEYELHFAHTEQFVRLEIRCWQDSRRVRGHSEVVFSVTGSYQEICLPFWRGLRELQGRFTPDEFERRWYTRFPDEKLDALSKALGK